MVIQHARKVTPKSELGRDTAHPRFLSTDDDALILEALRIASDTLLDVAARHARVLPSSPMTEHMRMLAERMEDLREALDA
jgi:hypothetical protein